MGNKYERMEELQKYMERHEIKNLDELAVYLGISRSVINSFVRNPKYNMRVQTIQLIVDRSKEKYGEALLPRMYLDFDCLNN